MALEGTSWCSLAHWHCTFPCQAPGDEWECCSSPPGKSLFTHSHELIPSMLEACLPAEAGAHRLANKQKRDCVLGAGEKARPALFQGKEVVGPSPELCRVQLGRGWYGRQTGHPPPPPQGSCSWEKGFHQRDTAVESWVLGGKCFLKAGNSSLLRCGVLCLLETCMEE